MKKRKMSTPNLLLGGEWWNLLLIQFTTSLGTSSGQVPQWSADMTSYLKALKRPTLGHLYNFANLIEDFFSCCDKLEHDMANSKFSKIFISPIIKIKVPNMTDWRKYKAIGLTAQFN